MPQPPNELPGARKGAVQVPGRSLAQLLRHAEIVPPNGKEPCRRVAAEARLGDRKDRAQVHDVGTEGGVREGLHHPHVARRRAIRTVLNAAAYLLRDLPKPAELTVPDFLAYVPLIQTAYKLGYRGPLLQIERVK